MKFSVCNLGCKVNAYEAEAIASVMEKRGWERVDFKDEADACLIFSCAVTNTAAAKSRRMLHRARRISPQGILVMAGCYAEVAEEQFEEADLVIGTRDKAEIPDRIEQYQKNHQKVHDTGNLDHIPFDDLTSIQFENRTRAYLKVEDGCNQFCSYCIIPYARGRERSMNPDLVVEKAKEIAVHYPEIVLAGIHTGRYGKEYGMHLSDLLRRILREVPDLQRLRISSIEISEITDDFIDLMKEEPRIARHLHIPLQSGSDTVLKRMHRPYTTAEYYARISQIRQEIPDIAISCDLIVGFPGESEAEFAETCAFLKKCQFSFLHVFPYSLRKGTVAAESREQIDPQTKKERTEKCLAISRQLREQYEQAQAGREVDVIAETEEDGYRKGHASQYFEVYLDPSAEQGKMYHIKLKEYRNHHLYGEEVKHDEVK